MTEKCVFCKIVRKEDPNAVIEYESENIVIFKDIRPASDFHYLAVPKVHIKDANCLTVNDLDLVYDMREGLIKLMAEKMPEVKTNELSLGFHWPPFNSINHLHMHGIAPVSKMGFTQRLIFRPKNLWYCTTDYVINRIKSGTQATSK